MARRNKTQIHVADLLGITRQAVSRRLLGHVPFRIDELQKIADMLEVSVSELLADDERASA